MQTGPRWQGQGRAIRAGGIIPRLFFCPGRMAIARPVALPLFHRTQKPRIHHPIILGSCYSLHRITSFHNLKNLPNFFTRHPVFHKPPYSRSWYCSPLLGFPVGHKEAKLFHNAAIAFPNHCPKNVWHKGFCFQQPADGPFNIYQLDSLRIAPAYTGYSCQLGNILTTAGKVMR